MEWKIAVSESKMQQVQVHNRERNMFTCIYSRYARIIIWDWNFILFSIVSREPLSDRQPHFPSFILTIKIKSM